jgi:flagellar hook protein FlgE
MIFARRTPTRLDLTEEAAEGRDATMMPAMYAAISGLEVHQTMLDVTANNLANVDTAGYKAQRTTFTDELSQTLTAGAGSTANNGGTNPKQVGLGVQLGSIDNMMTMGSLQSTGNPTDVAIQGNGFLRVGLTTGVPDNTKPLLNVPTNLQFTRAGNLTTNAQGFLTTQSGQYVVGKNAVPTTAATTPPSTTYQPGAVDTNIVIPPGSTDISIGQDGSVSYVDQAPASATFGQRVTGAYISLATFPNEAGLQRDGGSNWSATSNSGPANPAGTPNTVGFGQTIAGSIEMSNVDLATEFTNMITAQRGYEANSKVISTADQMLQTVTAMKQ